MAGSKETTRQKMINLMYLVFIAMLALNISKEVLGTLGILTEDIQLSNTELQKQIDIGYAKIEEGNKQAGDRYTAAFQEKDNLKSVTGDFYNYLEGINNMLLNDENGNKDEKLRKKIKIEGEAKDSVIWDYQLMTKGKELQDYFFLKPTTETPCFLALLIPSSTAYSPATWPKPCFASRQPIAPASITTSGFRLGKTQPLSIHSTYLGTLAIP